MQGAAALVERRYVRRRVLDEGPVRAGAIEQCYTVCNPPPKHKRNSLGQAPDIAAESRAGESAAIRATSSSLASASVSAAETTFASASGARALPPRRRGGAGRDAARDAEGERWLALLTPAALPPGVERIVDDTASKWYRVRLGASPIAVVLEIEVWQGELWAHLAATGRTASPTLAELAWCREVFLGDRKAIQILPRKAEAFDAGLRTVHLYAPLESDALPSFSRAHLSRRA
jgi:hypothetical protein